MKPAYRTWIINYLSDLKSKGKSCRNMCVVASTLMFHAFPGKFVICYGAVQTEEGMDKMVRHTWLREKSTQRIVDPTESQFFKITKYYPLFMSDGVNTLHLHSPAFDACRDLLEV